MWVNYQPIVVDIFHKPRFVAQEIRHMLEKDIRPVQTAERKTQSLMEILTSYHG